KERVRESKAEDLVRTSKYDLKEFLEITWRNGNGLCSVKDIQVWMHLTSRNQIGEKLDLGVESGFLEVATMPQQGDEFWPTKMLKDTERMRRTLTDKEAEWFKPKTGAFPKVYRMTKNGCEWIGVEPTEVTKRE
ncbi:hypothetical protein MUP77_23140, partial [Candidatus Bathyarchaeota archaeon]|nr:hypothetical protein [Candidatus Bathyarchaeota archaeon]